MKRCRHLDMTAEPIPLSNLVFGDIIEIERHIGPFTYYHCGIYGWNQTLIHKGMPPRTSGFDGILGKMNDKVSVRVDNLLDVADGSKIFRNNMFDSVVTPDPSVIELRTMASFGEANYHLVCNNCQHFCTKMRYDMAISRQADFLGRGNIYADSMVPVSAKVSDLGSICDMPISDLPESLSGMESKSDDMSISECTPRQRIPEIKAIPTLNPNYRKVSNKEDYRFNKSGNQTRPFTLVLKEPSFEVTSAFENTHYKPSYYSSYSSDDRKAILEFNRNCTENALRDGFKMGVALHLFAFPLVVVVFLVVVILCYCYVKNAKKKSRKICFGMHWRSQGLQSTETEEF